MDQNDQDFLNEIRALIGGEEQETPLAHPEPETAPEPEAPARKEPEKPAEPEKQEHRRERKEKRKKEKKTKERKARRAAEPIQVSEPEENGAGRRRRPPKRRSFPWALLFLTLLVIAGLVYAGLRYQKDMTAPPTEPETTAAETEPLESQQTVTIAAVGDVTASDALLASARQPDGSYDFSTAFLQAAPVLTEADIAVANLDLNFCGEPYGEARRSMPYALAEALAASGVDMVQMANTYSVINGIDGLEQSLTAVRQAGMVPLGAYADQADYQKSRGVTVCEVNGLRVVFVAFTKGVDNLSLPEGHENCVNLLYQDYDSTYSRVDTEGIQQVLTAAAEQKPDITIAMVHWGSEYSRNISSTQKEIRSLLLAGGVDVILGTHSHRVGELTVETGKDGSTVTAYSLGNFYGDDSYSGTQASLILELEFTMDNLSGRVRLTDVRYTPLYIASPEESGLEIYEVLDIDRAMELYDENYVNRVSESTYETLVAAKERIAGVLGESINTWKQKE